MREFPESALWVSRDRDERSRDDPSHVARNKNPRDVQTINLVGRLEKKTLPPTVVASLREGHGNGGSSRMVHSCLTVLCSRVHAFRIASDGSSWSKGAESSLPISADVYIMILASTADVRTFPKDSGTGHNTSRGVTTRGVLKS